jgi:Mn-containing catalase
MFIHHPIMFTEVRVTNPDPVFAEKLLEQYGGGTGELTAALTYLTQSYHTDNRPIRDMLQDIATEEFSHLEVIAMLIEQHTQNAKQNIQEAAYRSTLFAIRGAGPHLIDSQGTYWDGRYVQGGGHIVRDLRADVAAEAGALNTYEALLRLSPDEGTSAALRTLATREVAHTQMFMEALKTVNGLTEPLFGNLKPDHTVDLYFNTSNGPDADYRGPWNSEPAFKYIADPMQEVQKRFGHDNYANEMALTPGLGQPPLQSTAPDLQRRMHNAYPPNGQRG